jgi:hypothetical protein
MRVGMSFRTTLLLPHDVSTFAQMLIMRLMPIGLGTPVWASILLPKKISTLPNDLIEAGLCFRKNMSIISIRSQRSSPADMNLGGQVFEFWVRYQLGMTSGRSCFCFIHRVCWRGV